MMCVWRGKKMFVLLDRDIPSRARGDLVVPGAGGVM